MLKAKLFIFLFILFFSKNLNAKTVGNYIGIDIIKTALSFSEVRTIYQTNEVKKSMESIPTPSYSFGLKYNYAINYRGFFISPGLIYEKNNNRGYFNSDGDARSSKAFFGKSYSEINQRLGAKLDLGGDINEDVSIYGTFGYALNYYKSYSSLYSDRYYNHDNYTYYTVKDDPWKLNKDKKWAPFFGGGFRIKLHKNWFLNGEYNYTKFNSNTKTQEQPVIEVASNKQDNNTESTKNLFKNTVQIFKLGINYNF
jgi:opacity protein-like surface antigen